ncbi:MAG: glucan biosynthesis protein G [Proteobacteria bacterium ST_bin15]|nr:MAG: glucan biosynthesis protein G [Proteobacteria bacterium ST_bin15]
MERSTLMRRRDFFKTATILGGHVMLAGGLAAQTPPFAFDTVIARARALSQQGFQPGPQAPDNLRQLGFDAYRDLRFRRDRALLDEEGSRYRLQMFHLGFLYTRPVSVSIVRDGAAQPITYRSDLFDLGRNKFDPPLPETLGFAGFRLHYPLNQPKLFDELVSFLGASYFRLLGRGQRYGLSARGLAIDTAVSSGEEFPSFREFWIVPPAPGGEQIMIYALLDSPSVTGAYAFALYPGEASQLTVQVTLFARKPIRKLGLAPLSSMFFYGENQLRPATDYRPKVHDSDGLLIHTGAGEWIWRPLRNPNGLAVSAFLDDNMRGFGLVQRDRAFDHYQDLDLRYEARPTYWIEPVGAWGEGHVELIEIPTPDETNDNISAFWVPRSELKVGEPISFAYRLRALMSVSNVDVDHPGGRVVNTFSKRLLSHEAAEHNDPTVRRFLVDFAGGELAYFMRAPGEVEVMPSAPSGQILRKFVIANPDIAGIRAVFDFKAPPNSTTDLRAYLRAGDKTLSETWIYPWRQDG